MKNNKSLSFSEILQRGIDKQNRKAAKNRSLMDSILAQNQAAGKPGGPILLSALVKR